MNILFFGSDQLLERVRKQVVGLKWDIYRAEEPDSVVDFDGTHSFQAAIFGLCEDTRAVRVAAGHAKYKLNVPATIGLVSQDVVVSLYERVQPNLDILIPECGNDSLTKHQCDSVLRFANGSNSEVIACSGVSFHTSEDRFSVNGRDIYLPRKKHKLLELLFLRRGRVVTKQMVFDQLYGWDEPPDAKVVDVFICQIRRALREAGLKQECIQNVWGQGYRVLENASLDSCRAA